MISHMTYHGVDPVHRGFFMTVKVHYSPSNSIVCYLGYTKCTIHHTRKVTMISYLL